MNGSSDDEMNFPHTLLLTDTEISKIRKAFANGASTNIKFSKTQSSKPVQSGEFIFSSSSIIDLPMAPIKGFFSLANSIAKESENMGAIKINNDILVDAQLNLLGKKFKKVISSIASSRIMN